MQLTREIFTINLFSFYFVPRSICDFVWPLAAAEDTLSQLPENSVTQPQQTFVSTKDSEVAEVILSEKATDTSGQIPSISFMKNHFLFITGASTESCRIIASGHHRYRSLMIEVGFIWDNAST